MPVAILLAAIVFPFVARAAEPWAARQMQKLPINQRYQIESIVQTAVSATEQVNSKLPPVSPDVKKAMCIATVNTMLAAAGLGADAAVVDALIESSVFELNQARPGGRA